MPINRGALQRAADWIMSNPDKHIAGTMAMDELGDVVMPLDPKAVCFCAMGRLALEAGVHIPVDSNRKLEMVGEAVGLDCYAINTVWRANDRQVVPDHSTRHYRGNPAVIDVLRKLAA